MLRSLKEFEQYTLRASDGDVGSVVDFLVDDEHWTIRYLVAETGGFLGGAKVLISPISFGLAEHGVRCFNLNLTREKVQRSPGINTTQPISRQQEREYYYYYDYPYYWGYSDLWGMGAYPALLAAGKWNESPPAPGEDPANVHLRSASDLRGYHILGSDASIGHVEDFIIDSESWEIRYLVVDTSNWWIGKKVLVAPRWAASVDGLDRTVSVALSRQAIKDCPEWLPTLELSREYEAQMYNHYGRPVYWDRLGRPVMAPPWHQSRQHASHHSIL